MRVICIDDSNGRIDDVKPPFVFGEQITVRVVTDIDYEDITYGSGVWCKSRFAPLSEINETEMERNYQPHQTPIVL